MKCGLFCGFLCHLLLGVFSQGVMQPPSITAQAPSTYIYRESSVVTLQCNGGGTPTPTFTWTYNGSPLDITADGNINQPDSTQGTIVFTSTSASDQGYYQCFATNVYGVAMSTMTFLQRAYIGSPPANPSIQPYSATQGTFLKMTCQPISSVPTAVYSWALSDGIGDPSPLPYTLSQRVNLDPFGNIYFANIVPSDELSGALSYSCIHRNPDLATTVGGSYSQISVKAATAVNTNPAIQYSTPSPALGLEGQSVTLYCIFSGYPTPAITWTKLSGNLPEGRYNISAYGTQLRMSLLQPSDAGTYQCSGGNGVGTSSVQISLTIEAVPVFVVPSDGPVNVNATVGDTITINCNAYGIPSPSPLWLMNGQAMSVSSPPERMTFGADGKNLTITSLCKSNCAGTRSTDLMVIQCNSSNTYGYDFGDGYINVLLSTQISDPPPNQANLQQNSILVLPCNGTSDPSTPPRADWYLNGQLLVYDPPFTQQLSDGSLQIDTNGAADWKGYAGQYTCNLTNGYSYSVDYCQVQVLMTSGAGIPWWIILLIVIALIIIILLIIACVYIHKNPGQDYLVDKNERKQGMDPATECRTMDTSEFLRPPPNLTASTATTLKMEDPKYANGVSSNPAFAMSGGDLVAGHRPPSYHGTPPATPTAPDSNGWAPYGGSNPPTPGRAPYYDNAPMSPSSAYQTGSPAPFSPRSDPIKPQTPRVLGLSHMVSPGPHYSGSEGGSLAEYGDGSFGKFNEDGSFIGEYNTRPYTQQGYTNPAINGSSDWTPY